MLGTWLWPGFVLVLAGDPGLLGTWLWPGFVLVLVGGPGLLGTWLWPGLLAGGPEDGGVALAQNLLTDSPAALAAASRFEKATAFVPLVLLGLEERAAYAVQRPYLAAPVTSGPFAPALCAVVDGAVPWAPCLDVAWLVLPGAWLWLPRGTEIPIWESAPDMAFWAAVGRDPVAAAAAVALTTVATAIAATLAVSSLVSIVLLLVSWAIGPLWDSEGTLVRRAVAA